MEVGYKSSSDFSVRKERLVGLARAWSKNTERRNVGKRGDLVFDDFRELLEDLFEDISDETKIKIIGMNNFLKKNHDYDRDMVRSSPILEFFDAYLFFLSTLHEKTSCLRMPWLVLARLINDGVYAPSFIIEETPFFEMIREHLTSNEAKWEIAVTTFYCACLQKNDTPPIVIDDMWDMALTGMTSFGSPVAKLRALDFIQRCLCYTQGMPPEQIARVNESIYSILTDYRKSRFYAKALEVLRCELTAYPEQFANVGPLLDIVTLCLQAGDGDVLVASYRILSVLFANPEIPMERFVGYVDYYSIISNIDSVDVRPARLALKLLIRIAERGPEFVEKLIAKDLIEALDAEETDRKLTKKQMIQELVRVILVNGKAQICFMMLTSHLFSSLLDEVEMLQDEEKLFDFMLATLQALEKVDFTGQIDQVKEALGYFGLFLPTMDRILQDALSERCVAICGNIMNMFPST